MNQDFGIAVSRKLMAALFKLGTQLSEVVNLTVEHYLHGAIFISKWLVPPGKIDDAEPSVAERHRLAAMRLQKRTIVVRPAMRNLIAHAFQHGSRQ